MSISTDQPRDDSPRVFISYSHDSPAHEERVLALAQRLRSDGINARLDQYVPGTPEQGWPRWMLDQLEWAKFVLVVCTETYYVRFRGHEEAGRGLGADWEGGLITIEVYRARSATTKFVPVLFEADLRFIPEPLRGLTHYVLDKAEAYTALVDFVAGQAGVQPGHLGSLVRRPRHTGRLLDFAGVSEAANAHSAAGEVASVNGKVTASGVQIGAINLTGAQGVIIAPSGPVSQTFGSGMSPREIGLKGSDQERAGRKLVADQDSRPTGGLNDSVAGFTALLGEIDALLDGTSLDSETRDLARQDLAAAASQAALPHPKLKVVVAKLEGVQKMAESEITGCTGENELGQLLQRCLAQAQRLFR